MRSIRLILAAALIAAGALVVVAAPAGATITVTTTVDENNVDGDCSLREAIASINTGTPVDACVESTGPIVLPPGTYDVATDLVPIAAMTIQGAGAGLTVLAWSGGVGSGSLFYINDADDFGISGVTMIGSPNYYLNKQCNNSSSIIVTDSVLVDSDNYGINHCLGPIVVARSTATGSGSYGINNNSGSVSLTDTLVADSGRYGVNTGAGNVALTSSTVSGAGRYGINTNEGVITLESSTIVGQFTRATLSSNATASITNSIVTGGGETGTCDLDVTSGGYNISDDDSCGFDQPTDLEETDPVLGPLADNGGYTPTFLPLTGSPAIDTGGDCPPVDQRGFPRPADGDQDGIDVCDRGSVEVQPPPVVPLTPTFTG